MVERTHSVVAVRPIRRPHGGLLMLLALLLSGPYGALAGGRQAGGHPCPVTLVGVRERRPADRPAVLELRFGVGADPASVLGPDSLRLIVDAPEGHPRVFIENMRTGAQDDIAGVWATRPVWSPDGRYVACETYPSQGQSYQLAVIDRRTRKRIVVEARVAADEYRWSPDSRWIAVEGVERGTNHVVLSVYDLVRGRLRRIATSSALGSYGLSWSPDSKFLAFTKPTAVGEDEAVLAADLWIVPTSSWLPCRVSATQQEIESQPEWLSNVAVLVKSVPSTTPRVAGRDLVFELRR
jgi:hypothetical protein